MSTSISKPESGKPPFPTKQDNPKQQDETIDKALDEAIEESFPASDPVSITPEKTDDES